MTVKNELPRLVDAQYATGEMWRNNSRKNEETEPKQKQHPVVDVTVDGSKVWYVRAILHRNLECYVHESRQIGSGQTGDGKSEYQNFRDSKLKWTGMGKFNSDDHYIYYHGQESFRRNAVAIIVNKRVWNAVLGCNLKNNRMISVHFQGKLSGSCPGWIQGFPQDDGVSD